MMRNKTHKTITNVNKDKCLSIFDTDSLGHKFNKVNM